jgi:hypothetical protein
LWPQYYGTWKQSDMVTLDETVEERKVNAPDRNRRFPLLRDCEILTGRRGLADVMNHLDSGFQRWNLATDFVCPVRRARHGDPHWDGQLALGNGLSLFCQSALDSLVEETSCAPVRSRTCFALAVQFRSSQ